MSFLSAFLFSLSANLDNFIIGASYELSQRRITLWENFLIAIIGTIGTYLSMLLGKFIANFLPSSTANLLGAFIIIAMGLYFIIDGLRHHDEPPQPPKTISLKNTLVLGFCLTLNNFGVGVASSITGLHIDLVCTMNFIFSMVLLYLGKVASDHVIGKFISLYSDIIAGFLLVILGALETF